MMQQRPEVYAAEGDDQEDQIDQKPKFDVFQKNQDKLREMQEARAKEARDIEEQRAKVKRMQEKAKQKILLEAQEYKKKKAERLAKQQDEEDQIQLSNQVGKKGMRGQ